MRIFLHHNHQLQHMLYDHLYDEYLETMMEQVESMKLMMVMRRGCGGEVVEQWEEGDDVRSFVTPGWISQKGVRHTYVIVYMLVPNCLDKYTDEGSDTHCRKNIDTN